MHRVSCSLDYDEPDNFVIPICHIKRGFIDRALDETTLNLADHYNLTLIRDGVDPDDKFALNRDNFPDGFS
jgi:hypothetical protein